MKWNPRTEKRQEPRGSPPRLPLSHHTCLQEETVMSPSSHLGDNGGWKKATGRKGRWEERVRRGGEGGVVEGPEEALCFIYHGYYVLAPSASAQ